METAKLNNALENIAKAQVGDGIRILVNIYEDKERLKPNEQKRFVSEVINAEIAEISADSFKLVIDRNTRNGLESFYAWFPTKMFFVERYDEFDSRLDIQFKKDAFFEPHQKTWIDRNKIFSVFVVPKYIQKEGSYE